MKIYTKSDLVEYMKNDWIMSMLLENETKEEKSVRTNQWLKEIEAKRMIYADVYGDFLQQSNSGLRVLDVGGGYNSLTKVMAQNVDYTLCDFLAHGGQAAILPSIVWVDSDWNDYYAQIGLGGGKTEFDVIVANDIFPDVDQRIEIFIEKSLKIAKEVRLVITYYNTAKYYLTKRVDDSELMTFLSWDGEIMAMKLAKYLDNQSFSAELRFVMENETKSIFRNGRQVAYVIIRELHKNG